MAGQLLNFTETLQSRAENRPVPPSPVPIVLHDDEEHGDDGELGYAEGQSFIIEYRAGTGHITTRRITVWAIKTGAGEVPVLVATCHERKASRTFRVDRILSCIDYDGEVHSDVQTFLVNSFGMSYSAARLNSENDDAKQWQKIKKLVASSAVLLAALSHSDGSMHPFELDIALAHCEREIDAAKLYLNEATLGSLNAYLRRLRPTSRDIASAANTLAAKSPNEIISVLSASARLVDADGVRHPDEVMLINDLAMDLIGVSVI